MSTVFCSFCQNKFATFNIYIQHLATNACGNKRESIINKKETSINLDKTDSVVKAIAKKRTLEEGPGSTPAPTLPKKTITQAMAPQQEKFVGIDRSKNVVKNGKLRCEFCMKMIKPRGMTQHLNIVHKCSFCGDLVENLDNHKAKNHLTESCSYCNEKFLNASKVEVHVKEEHLRVCNKCEEKFYNESSLNKHMEDVHDSEYCDLCDEKMRKEDNLMDDHKEKIHGIEKKVLKTFGGGMMFMMVSE